MLTLHLHDTMSREMRPVQPSDGQALRFYCCGPTVYGPAHIGNFRTFIMQDVFRRVLEVSGTPTRHVRNITDVDDKTIRQSRAEGRSLTEFTAGWTEKFRADCEALALLPPAIEPSAVAHIPEQIALIADLVAKGHAYRSEDGSVYFDVSSFAAYGALSRLGERTITTGQPADGDSQMTRENADEYQRDSAADFALWKAAKPEDGDNHWPSPWGDGRPGWHIECSAMAMKHLGQTLDLHSGGVDLIFPHHENEIAQSEASTGQTFSRHWFHVAHLLVEGTKMSKSLGNLFTLDDILARGFSTEELRYVLLSGHYRQPLNFTFDTLHAARQGLRKLRALKMKLEGGASEAFIPGQINARFAPVLRELLDDLNTPGALGQLFIASKSLEHDLPSLSPSALSEERRSMELCLSALGLRLIPEPVASAPETVQELAKQRWQAKLDKNWAEADRLRADITHEGWAMKDGKEGYELSPLS